MILRITDDLDASPVGEYLVAFGYCVGRIVGALDLNVRMKLAYQSADVGFSQI